SNLRNGQVNFLVLALCVAAVTLTRAQTITWPLSIAVKLVPLVLFPYFLFRRSWLWLAASVVLIAAWCLLPAVVVGRPIVGIYHRFWNVVFSTSLAAPAQLLDFSVAGTLSWLTGTPLTPVLRASATAVVIGWIMPVDARRLRALNATGSPVGEVRPASPADAGAFALYLLAIPLLSPQSEIHHLAFMLPAAAIVGAALWWDWPRATPALRVSALTAAGR